MSTIEFRAEGRTGFDGRGEVERLYAVDGYHVIVRQDGSIMHTHSIAPKQRKAEAVVAAASAKGTLPMSRRAD